MRYASRVAPDPLIPRRCIPRCAALLSLAASWTACTPFKSDPPSDAGGSSCIHREPPARPTATDDGAPLRDLVFAVSEYMTGDDAGRPQYQNIGFDLDHTCTGEGQGLGCVEPSYATGDHHDGVDGIDNAYGQIWWAKGVVPYEVTTAGTPTVIIRVGGYSGQRDDNQIEVSIYVGLLASREDGGTAGDGGSGPFWDGNDRWSLLPEMLAPSADGGAPSVDEPLFRDDQGYVSGGILVAQFPEARWTAGLAIAPKRLTRTHQLVLAGPLNRVAEGWELQNLVVGMRVDFNEILTFVANLIDSTNQLPECQSESNWRNTKNNICPYVDIASVPGPASAACDAISLGVLIQAKQALLGDVLSPSPPQVLDCLAGIHPETDTCDLSADQ
jgi:hypothetical protein